MSKQPSDIGLIGLAVMGQNLALNIADHGFRISVFNRTTSKTGEFVAKHPATPGGLHAALTLGTLSPPSNVPAASSSSFRPARPPMP